MSALNKSLLKSFERELFFLYKDFSFEVTFVQTCIAINSPVRHSSKIHPKLVTFEYCLIFTSCKRYLFVLLILIYVLEKREWVLFCPHKSVCLAYYLHYYLQINQLKLKNLYLDVLLFFVSMLKNQTSVIGI